MVDGVDKKCVMKKTTLVKQCETYDDCEKRQECARFTNGGKKYCVDREALKSCIPYPYTERCDHE